MPEISAVVVGYNQWDAYTKPLIGMAKKHIPGVRLIVVDNGSEPPYPQVKGVEIVRAEGGGYAHGLNAGIRAAGVIEWLMLLNNDVKIEAAFSLKWIDPNVLYCCEMSDWYAVSWCLLLSRKIWETVGEFDEGYYPLFYDDVDYSYRVLKAGFRIEVLKLPFEHLGHGTHDLLPDVQDARTKGERRFRQKFGIEEGIRINDIF
jgi:GT2 family glycosyltransferase